MHDPTALFPTLDAIKQGARIDFTEQPAGSNSRAPNHGGPVAGEASPQASSATHRAGLELA